ncbi:unnamed protein product [Boreogadus saida]
MPTTGTQRDAGCAAACVRLRNTSVRRLNAKEVIGGSLKVTQRSTARLGNRPTRTCRWISKEENKDGEADAAAPELGFSLLNAAAVVPEEPLDDITRRTKQGPWLRCVS